MGNLTFKPASGGDLILQNDDAGAKIQLNNDDTIDITGSIDTATFNGTIGTSATGSANLPAVKTALNASGSAPIYACRAWVNFDGTDSTAGYVAIRASGNVTSVADDGTGQYTVNFTTAMSADTFAAVGSARDPRLAVASSGNITTSNVQLTCDLGGSDTSHAFVAIFQ